MSNRAAIAKVVDQYLGHVRTYVEATGAGFDDAADEALEAMTEMERKVGPRAASVLQRAAVKIIGSVPS